MSSRGVGWERAGEEFARSEYAKSARSLYLRLANFQRKRQQKIRYRLGGQEPGHGGHHADADVLPFAGFHRLPNGIPDLRAVLAGEARGAFRAFPEVRLIVL